MALDECMNPMKTYLKEISEIRATGAGVTETFYYGPLANFLKQIGKNLKPKVHFVNNTKQSDGLPVKGLCTSDQSQKTTVADPLSGTIFSRGVIIVKPTSEDARLLTEQP